MVEFILPDIKKTPIFRKRYNINPYNSKILTAKSPMKLSLRTLWSYSMP